MARSLSALIFVVVGLGLPSVISAAPSCATLVPPQTRLNGVARTVEPEDLAAIRDIGPTGVSPIDAPIMSVSPDGSRVAFHMWQARPDENRYCVGLFTIQLGQPRSLRQLDQGGELIRGKSSYGGFAPRRTGFAAAVAPKWSPSGRRLAYLRRDKDQIDIWLIEGDGPAHRLIDAGYDIDSFDWVAEDRLRFSGRPGLADAEADITRRGRQGYAYDQSFAPTRGLKPLVREPLPVVEMIFDLTTGERRMPTPEELRPSDAAKVLMSAQGHRAERVAVTDRLDSRTRLDLQMTNGRRLICPDVVCDGIRQMWWTADGRQLIFLKQEAQAPEMGLYRLATDTTSGMANPERIFHTTDALKGCAYTPTHLVCGFETATHPRTLVRIDLSTGILDPVFDPNPEFSTFRFGAVERLRWRNSRGIETFGSLVLPPDYSGGRLPLVVVGYDARGFLRGGTGDEYPVHALSAKGFAVLVYEQPPGVGRSSGARTSLEAEQIDRQDWADKRSVLSSLETVIDRLVARGLVDARRVGLTGFSYGRSTAQFAAVNSGHFTVMSVSGCCEDIYSAATWGPAGAAYMKSLGYPDAAEVDQAFWGPYSMILNASRLKIPTLIQISDDELLSSLQSFHALKRAESPVDMIVFPDERHVKWQPAHRLAMYRRNIAWFDYWLLDRQDLYGYDEDYQRWDVLKRTVKPN
ncbi:Atxe2 family lasso peptide isopeptidase [Asticcacaulis sp. YBE204]|uniref:Atxe2 family lasso peptide isopeptidase n=1 Tax=Asticcacaulis sp. YBE204 TaxID=1282363 RepID=UPI0003C3FC59|nr:Atxe2 family lasso peptide isopeptidase [Asticcacaulis sp. YBE204]ESQ79306.1 hypothetical protein AEYBE204_09865 [Asticcacaulis sp. YBE204]